MSINMKDFLEEKKEFSRVEIMDAFNNAIPKEMMKDMPELILLLGIISAKAVSDLFGEEEPDNERSSIRS